MLLLNNLEKRYDTRNHRRYEADCGSRNHKRAAKTTDNTTDL